MTHYSASPTQTAAALRQALGPGFGLAGVSDLMLNAVVPQPTVELRGTRR
ncbi:MAG: hypothetical protein ACRBK7_29910 [Acidimicrobiales bacterium]